MGWNTSRRPKSSNKLGIPNEKEGGDGDIQIRQTNLGAKLFGKIGGRWHSTFLSKEQEIIGTSGTKIGMTNDGAFSVDSILLNGKIALTEANTNVAIGTGNSTIGTDNIAIGVQAGNDFESGAIKNVVVGNYAGNKISSGDWNVMIGYYAGANPSSGAPTTTGSKNICIGFGAVCDAAGDNDEIVIGEAVKGKGSNTITIGGSDMTDFYCGTDQDLTFRNAAGSMWTGGGTGDNHGIHITSANGTGTDATIYLYRGNGKSNAYDLGTAAWRISTDDSANDNFYIYDDIADAVRAKIDGSGAGDFYTNDGSVSNLSDVRVKKDINDLADGLDIVNQLRPRTYKFNGKNRMSPDDNITRYGFIADEVLTVAPQYVSIREEEIDGVKVNDFKSLSTGRMIPMMINAVQELSAKVDTMQTEINNLKSE